MHAGETVQETPGITVPERDRAPLLHPQRERAFWLGLFVALMAHSALMLALTSAAEHEQRRVGVDGGAEDSIAVEIVDAATLRDSMEPPAPPSPPPAMQPQQPMAQPAQQPQQAEPPAPQEEQQTAMAEPEPPQPPPPQTEVSDPVVEPPPAPEPPAEQQQNTQALKPALDAAPPDPVEKALEDAPALAEAAEAEKAEEAKEAPEEAKKEEAKPAEKPKEAPKAEAKPPEVKKEAQKQKPPTKQQPKKRSQRTAALDLSMPSEMGESSSDAGGASSMVQRPPGITRSGENDAFALDVIRALRRSMPPATARGRVTVRIVLSENGSRADVKVVNSGGNPDMDFNIVFAARQTAYPFPPRNSTVADRTFTVTYIYR